MLSPTLKSKLKRLPFSRRVEEKLLAGGHTPREAEIGALLVAALDLLILVILLNSFAWGLLLTLTKDVSVFLRAHPAESVLGGFALAILIVSLFFSFVRSVEDKRQLEERARRQQEALLAGKRDAVRRGAMGSFPEVFRADLERKRPDLRLIDVSVVDTTPRIRFRMARFTTEQGGDVDANYRLFREKLFSDALALVRTAFELSPNIPVVVVDAIFNFINRKARFYDGAVLSVRATREVFRSLDLDSMPPFRALNAFDLRYNDGLEVEAHPEEQSKNARLLEKLRRSQPKADIRYESAPPPTDDGWRPAEPPPLSAAFSAETPADPTRLPADRYQAVVQAILDRQGFAIRKIRKIPGGTVEILASHSHPLLGGEFVVLSRQYPEEAQVHAELVRELDQLVVDEGAQRGIYVVSGKFTDEAGNIARHLPLTLVDGRRLKSLLASTAIPPSWEGFPGLTPGSVPDLDGMSLNVFQETVGSFVTGLGFRVDRLRKMTDGAIFAKAVEDHPLLGGEFVFIARQVPPNREVAAEAVRETARIMEAEFCPRGFLLLTGPVSGEARALARSLSVDPVDRSRWIRLYSGSAPGR